MPSSPQGLAVLKQMVENTPDYPTVAIGGINIERVPAVLATGVGSVAVVSAITRSDNWQQATAQLLRLIECEELADDQQA
jgi:thiamine-phosphate pyrophosphorylase